MKYGIIILVAITFISCDYKPTNKPELEGQLLPNFNLLLVDSVTYFNTSTLKSNMPTILFYFSPNCPYSRAQMEDFVSNIQSLRGIQFCILTTELFNDLKTFYKDYRLNSFPNMTVGEDYTHFFQTYFKTNAVPYLAIYDVHKRLKQVLIGKSEIGTIRELVFQ